MVERCDLLDGNLLPGRLVHGGAHHTVRPLTDHILDLVLLADVERDLPRAARRLCARHDGCGWVCCYCQPLAKSLLDSSFVSLFVAGQRSSQRSGAAGATGDGEERFSGDDRGRNASECRRQQPKIEVEGVCAVCYTQSAGLVRFRMRPRHEECNWHAAPLPRAPNAACTLLPARPPSTHLLKSPSECSRSLQPSW